MHTRVKKAVKTVNEKGGIFTFIRAQFSSQVSSLADYAVSLTLVNVFGMFFGYATFCGNITGGIVNCIVNYKWTFKAQGSKIKDVAIKYIMVWIVNLFLNTQGTILVTGLITGWLKSYDLPTIIDNNLFLIPKIIVSLIVGFGWNYNMQRLFVYKDRNIKQFFTGKKNNDQPLIQEETTKTSPEEKIEAETDSDSTVSNAEKSVVEKYNIR